MDELTCVVCCNPATQKYRLTTSSDVDPIYADVCDECAEKHTWQCIDLHLQIADCKRDWPDYCRKCSGWGAHYFPGTMWDPPDCDVCECINEGRCPRCGHQHDEDWEGEDCEACCWHFDQDGILEAECHCNGTVTLEVRDIPVCLVTKENKDD